MVVGNSLRYLLIFFVSNCLLTIRPIDGYECYTCDTGEGSSCDERKTEDCYSSGKSYCQKMIYKKDYGDDKKEHTLLGCGDYCPDKDGKQVTITVGYDYQLKKSRNITGTVYCCGGGHCNDPRDDTQKDSLQCIECVDRSGSYCTYTRTDFCDSSIKYCSTNITEDNGVVSEVKKGCGALNYCPDRNGKQELLRGSNLTVYCCQGDNCNAAHDTPGHLQCLECDDYSDIPCNFPRTTHCGSKIKYCSKVVYEIHGYEYFARGCGDPDHCPGKDGEVTEYSYGAERTEYCCEGDRCNAAQDTRNTISLAVGPVFFLLLKVVQLL